MELERLTGVKSLSDSPEDSEGRFVAGSAIEETHGYSLNDFDDLVFDAAATSEMLSHAKAANIMPATGAQVCFGTA